MSRSRRSFLGMAVASMLILGTVTPVVADGPPVNDDAGGAIPIGSTLPQLLLEDARTATASPSEACGTTRTSVWFTFIPERDGALWIEPLTSVGATGALYREAADAAHLQACVHGATTVAMTGHARYLLMLGGTGEADGFIGVRLRRDPREARLSIDPIARLRADGTVSLSGSATCDVPAGIGGLSAAIAQPAVRPRISARSSVGARCSAGPTSWSVTLPAGSVPFRLGPTRVSVEASFCDRDWCAAAQLVATVDVVAARAADRDPIQLPWR